MIHPQDHLGVIPLSRASSRDPWVLTNFLRVIRVRVPASPVELRSACPGSHHILATTAPHKTGRLLSQAFQCGHSTALPGADIADIRPPADNQPEPVLDPVSAMPLQASKQSPRQVRVRCPAEMSIRGAMSPERRLGA